MKPTGSGGLEDNWQLRTLLKELLTRLEILSGPGTRQNKIQLRRNLMNAVLSASATAERSLSSEGEGETSRPVEQEVPKTRLAIEADAERIKSAVVRLTANSIDGLEGLASELQQLQAFLKCEVERVQGEIESALAGINIIIETIAPWKTISAPLAAPTNARAVRAGPAYNIESAQSRR